MAESRQARRKITEHEFRACLTDPDDVGESEYRTVYDFLLSMIVDEREDDLEMLIAVAQQFEDAASTIRDRLGNPRCRWTGRCDRIAMGTTTWRRSIKGPIPLPSKADLPICAYCAAEAKLPEDAVTPYPQDL